MQEVNGTEPYDATPQSGGSTTITPGNSALTHTVSAPGRSTVRRYQSNDRVGVPKAEPNTVSPHASGVKAFDGSIAGSQSQNSSSEQAIHVHGSYQEASQQ
jgi:hypothetical protein